MIITSLSGQETNGQSPTTCVSVHCKSGVRFNFYRENLVQSLPRMEMSLHTMDMVNTFHLYISFHFSQGCSGIFIEEVLFIYLEEYY